MKKIALAFLVIFLMSFSVWAGTCPYSEPLGCPNSTINMSGNTLTGNITATGTWEIYKMENTQVFGASDWTAFNQLSGLLGGTTAYGSVLDQINFSGANFGASITSPMFRMYDSKVVLSANPGSATTVFGARFYLYDQQTIDAANLNLVGISALVNHYSSTKTIGTITGIDSSLELDQMGVGGTVSYAKGLNINLSSDNTKTNVTNDIAGVFLGFGQTAPNSVGGVIAGIRCNTFPTLANQSFCLYSTDKDGATQIAGEERFNQFDATATQAQGTRVVKEWHYAKTLAIDADDACDTGTDCFTVPAVTSSGYLHCFDVAITLNCEWYIDSGGVPTEVVDTNNDCGAAAGGATLEVFDGGGASAIVLNEHTNNTTIVCEMTYD